MHRIFLIILSTALCFSNCSTRTTSSDSDKEGVKQNNVLIFDSELILDSLDIELLLPNRILNETATKIDFTINNNSAYPLLLDTPYSIKHLEFGFYGDIPFPKDVILISTRNPDTINPKENSEVFNAYFEGYDFSFPPGSYKLTQEVGVLDINADNEKTVIGRMILEADFEIK